MTPWQSSHSRCAICGRILDEREEPIYAVYHEHCLPPCELCGKEIHADLCGDVYRDVTGKWTARHREPCPD